MSLHKTSYTPYASYNEASHTAIYNLNATLLNGTEYTIIVSNKIKDTEGNTIKESEDNSFTTLDASTNSICGDGVCSAGEDESSCSADCTAASTCGDGVCDAGENTSICYSDCTSSNQYDGSLVMPATIPETINTHHSFIYNDKIYMVQQVNNYSGSYKNRIYVYYNSSWQMLQEFDGLWRPLVVHIDDNIYIIGGKSYLTNNIEGKVLKYNITSNSLVEMAVMNFPRAAMGGAVYNNKIYVFGGLYRISGTEYKSSKVELFNPFDGVNGSWQTLSDWTNSLNHSNVISYNNFIYLIGGTTTSDPGNGHSNLAYKYNPVNDTYLSITNYPTTIAGGALSLTYNNKIYVLDGEDIRFGGSTGKVNSYDPITNTWTNENNLNGERYFSSGFVYEDIFYMFGGTDSSIASSLSSVGVYNPIISIPTDSLIAYYPFNGNANDESANAHNGTVNGASLTTDRFGNANSAYSFDGVDDYIDLGDLGYSILDDYTISLWVKFTDLTNTQN